MKENIQINVERDFFTNTHEYIWLNFPRICWRAKKESILPTTGFASKIVWLIRVFCISPIMTDGSNKNNIYLYSQICVHNIESQKVTINKYYTITLWLLEWDLHIPHLFLIRLTTHRSKEKHSQSNPTKTLQLSLQFNTLSRCHVYMDTPLTFEWTCYCCFKWQRLCKPE